MDDIKMPTPKYKVGQLLLSERILKPEYVEVLFSVLDKYHNFYKYVVKREDGYTFLVSEQSLSQPKYKWGDRVEIIYQGAWREGKYIVYNEKQTYCHAVLIESDNNVTWGTDEDVRRKACI